MGVSVRTSRVVSCLDVVLCTCPESKRSGLGVLLRVYHAFRGLLANVVCHIRSSHIGSRGGGASLVALGGGFLQKSTLTFSRANFVEGAWVSTPPAGVPQAVLVRALWCRLRHETFARSTHRPSRGGLGYLDWHVGQATCRTACN